jgi:hypothetical protein
MPPQGRQGGPGPAQPTQTGRATGAGTPVDRTVARRYFTVNGERYDAPVDVTDEQIAEVLGAMPDAPEFGGGAGPTSPDTRELMGSIPSMVYGGMGLAGALKKPIMAAGKYALRKAAPNLLRSQAELALEKGAGRLTQASIRKLADAPWTQRVMAQTIKDAPATIQPADLALRAGGAHLFGGTPAAVAMTAGRVLTRPKPLAAIGQALFSGAPAAGAAGGAGIGALAQQALMKLFGGGE